MSAETTKAIKRRKGTWLFNKIFSGHGIDIGSGSDLLKKEDFPNIKSVQPFDLEHGDAQFISQYVKQQYDFVHSSNCLEHMREPQAALLEWIKIVKPGGYLIVTLPDEKLYEQDNFPSLYNSDHKHTFSIYRLDSPAPKYHINIIEMLIHMNNLIDIIKIELIDTNYDYNLKNVDQTRGESEAFIEFILQRKYDIT